MKRIAIFSVAYEPFIGGAEVAVRQITDRLPGYSFDLYTAKMDPALAPHEHIGNVCVYRLGTGKPFLDKLLFAWRAKRAWEIAHKKSPYALNHAIMANYAGLAALLIKKKYPLIPYVLTLQSGDSDWFILMRTWFWHYWYACIYRKADHIVAISSWLARRAKRYGYTRMVEIIPNGVDVSLFNPHLYESARAEVRASLGMNTDAHIVFSASRLVGKNGIDILIRALGELGSAFHVVLAGDGPDRKKLEQLAQSFPMRVHFLGAVSYAQLPRYYASADVFCRPSRTEGLGNVFLEAMAMRVPVVATPVGGIVDIVQDSETGMLAKPNNPESVAQKILALKNNPTLREHIVHNAHVLVRGTYEWSTIARRYDAMYKARGRSVILSEVEG